MSEAGWRSPVGVLLASGARGHLGDHRLPVSVSPISPKAVFR